ncbi:MAG: NACHT domain-containing protein [Symploca sp. SIO1C2]|nr:NACHT domain-containing protein [Symploca sp. SIO1C2]
MRTEMQERLAQSLHNKVWLTLGMERQNYHVERPFSTTVVQPSQSPAPLAAGTRIVEVFNRPELNRQLLILGEPGAGKTTMMLELAEDLLRRAIADKTEPIPVLLNLSSWKNPQQSIFDWLLGELKEKYGIRKNLAQRWLEANQLLPLLDGLDEVAPQHQQACAVALNHWLKEFDPRSGVLICCRREEFEQGVRQPLSLYGAIYVQPLTIEQIEDYFTQFNLQNVWQTVQQDEALQEILTKPLFLSMFGLVQTQDKFSLSDWQSCSTSEDRIEYLLDTYWEATMSRTLITNPREKQQGIHSKTYSKKPVPTRQEIRRALVFTAKMLNRESSTELLIEKMQPTALSNLRQKWTYQLIYGLIGWLIGWLIIGLVIGLIIGLIGVSIIALIVGLFFWTIDKLNFPFLSVNFLIVGLIIWLIIGLIVGLVIWLIGRLEKIEPVEEIAISMSHEARREILGSLRKWLIIGLIIWLIIGLIGLLIFELLTWLIIGLVFWLIIGLIGLMIEGRKADIQTPMKPNQGIKNSVKNMIIANTIAFVISLFFKFTLQNLLANVVDFEVADVIVNIFVAMLMWLSFYQAGGNALSQHIALRLVLDWNRYAPLRYELLLNYCTERLLLQRVGGRYRFMHKFLQDHFARMDLNRWEEGRQQGITYFFKKR